MTLPTIVDDAEEVATFVFESNKIKGNDLDFRQLMPSKRFGDTSVYRILGFSEAEIADAGHAIALARPKPGILGWGVLIARAIRLIPPLRINAAAPPPRHALIEGWPAAIQEQRALAMNLASKAKVTKKSTIPPGS